LRKSNIPLGIAFIVVSSVLFAPTSQTATKFLAAEFPIVQIIFFRSLGQFFWLLVFFWRGHGAGMFRTANRRLQWGRSILLAMSMTLWVSVIAEVPLTTASAINFTAPIMVVVLSIPLLGERVGIHRWAAVLMGFTGALVIINPLGDSVPVEIVTLLGAAALFALYQILTRQVTATDSAATTAMYGVLAALIGSAFLVPWHNEPVTPGNIMVWIAFAATGLLGGIRHLFVVNAYQHAPASVVSPFFYCELVGVALLGFVVFGDVPTSRTLVGASIIVISGLYIAHRERVASRRLHDDSKQRQ
jgi:drug/metabolite transporter (DMT)-like permease